MSKTTITREERDFYKKQIETTISIVETFSNNNEFSPTMLINSLLSLVVLPFEAAKKHDRTKTFPGSLETVMKSFLCYPEIFSPIKCCNGEKVLYGNKTIYSFVNKFRNGIAHQNLRVNVDENRNITITIYNIFVSGACKNCKNKVCKEKGLSPSRGKVEDFRITVTVPQLQKIALYIANSYLKSMDE